MTLPLERYRAMIPAAKDMPVDAFRAAVWQHAHYVETNEALALLLEQRELIAKRIYEYRDALLLDSHDTDALGAAMIVAFGEGYASLAQAIRRDIDSSYHIHFPTARTPG